MTKQISPRVLVIIPARYSSTRYPGKPLAVLKGATGIEKTLIERSWDAARSVRGVDKVLVATDSIEIQNAAEGFGAEVVLTSVECQNGTERCSEVARKYPDYDIYVNLQGDAPLTPSVFVEDLIRAFSDERVKVATPALRCDEQALSNLRADRVAGRVGGTTVVFDQDDNAMYFSKEVIPYTPENASMKDGVPVFHHVGVYAYRKSALEAYCEISQGIAEKYEGLEQLRFLESGIPVKCVRVSGDFEFWELNNPSDVPIIEKCLLDRGMK